MNKNRKVTLRDILVSKVVRNIAIAVYFWMWARTDYKESYSMIQSSVGAFLAVFYYMLYSRERKYKKECFDELAERNLNKCNAICYKIMAVIMVALAFTAAIVGHTEAFGTDVIGWILVISLVVVSIVRVILYSAIDKKGE
ncbi:hypothetical protein [Butyrivibrio sp. AE2005]|uniref:hypothetical protein n=1 Tax=Butyrivibrio sp. AE2005 TaxID=1496722 RepID=UPI00047A5B54|nr:hypothetical protein [Butyrivibrio sp. AE2005]